MSAKIVFVTLREQILKLKHLMIVKGKQINLIIPISLQHGLAGLKKFQTMNFIHVPLSPRS